jgi:hypothetical protein
MIPLYKIPDLYVGDPQQGLKEILRHMPGCTATAWHVSALLPSTDWLLDVHSPTGVLLFSALYQEPLILATSLASEVKAARIHKWLDDLCRFASAWVGPVTPQSGIEETTITIKVPAHAPTLKSILQEAKVSPELPPKAASRHDAFAAKVIARRAAI